MRRRIGGVHSRCLISARGSLCRYPKARVYLGEGKIREVGRPSEWAQGGLVERRLPDLGAIAKRFADVVDELDLSLRKCVLGPFQPWQWHQVMRRCFGCASTSSALRRGRRRSAIFECYRCQEEARSPLIVVVFVVRVLSRGSLCICHCVVANEVLSPRVQKSSDEISVYQLCGLL
jgi:hypothetical protein